MIYKFKKTLVLHVDTDSKEKAEKYVKNLNSYHLDASDVINDFLVENVEELAPEESLYEEVWVDSKDWIPLNNKKSTDKE